MKWRHLVSFIAVGSALASSAARVGAEDRDAATAGDAVAASERLFQQGLALMKADHCQDAIPLFLESQRLDRTAATAINLASCHARLQKIGTALRMYRQAARIAVLEGNDELRAQADRAVATLEPKVAKLRILSSRTDQSMTIRVNGDSIEYDRTAVPLDPGENVVEAVLPGHEPWRRTITAEPPTILAVEIPELPPVKPLQPESALERPKDMRPVAGVVAGAGVIGLIVGGVLAANAKSAWDDSNAYCQNGHCTQSGIDLRATARDRASGATWATVLGAVAVGSGVAVWFLFPGPKKTELGQAAERARLVPWMGASGGAVVGLSLEGRL